MPVVFSLLGCRTFDDLRAHFNNEWEKSRPKDVDFKFMPGNEGVKNAHQILIRNIYKRPIEE